MNPELLDVPIDQISEDQFENIYDEMMGEKGIREKSVVTGTVISIGDDWVTIDINYKAEGLVYADEFRDENGELDIEPGDEVDVYLGSLDAEEGALVLSKRRADLMKAWEEISEAVERDEVVSGTIVARVKGGLSVDIGVKAFLPGSQVDLRPVKNLEKLIGETYDFKIIKFNKKRGNIVLSRRVLLEQERAVKREETLDKLNVGAILTGVVKNLTDYGAFIDLGGIDGLLHITDMSYGRLNHPTEMFEVGQTVEVKILKFDPETQRVSLGYKQIKPDPWEEAGYKYPIGAIVRGKVVSLPDYGAFVELEDGIEGLVHISEMTWNKRVKHPSKLVDVGDIIEAKVLDVDVEEQRISLSMKQLEANPWDLIEQKYPIGSMVKGEVRNITDFGIFVGIEDGIDGLVHISDLSWGQRIKHPSDRYSKGDEVEARVLAIDKENERFSLGIKQMTEDPWYTVHSRYFLGQIIEGPVVHATDFGVFVEIEEGVEGLVHISELAYQADDWQKKYPVSKKIRAEVIHIDSHDRKISLSERGAVEREAEGEEPEVQRPAPSARLGDVMGDLGKKFQSGDAEAEAAANAAPDATPEGAEPAEAKADAAASAETAPEADQPTQETVEGTAPEAQDESASEPPEETPEEAAEAPPAEEVPEVEATAEGAEPVDESDESDDDDSPIKGEAAAAARAAEVAASLEESDDDESDDEDKG